MKIKDKITLINAAKEQYACCDIEIDTTAKVSGTPLAAWVQAWVWVELPVETRSATSPYS